MKLFSEGKNYKLYQGDMLNMLDVIAPNSIESVVTDPPYELGFMNKGWDASGIAFRKETWEKCFTVLKPGGYLLAFGGSRTYHRIACAIEDAGFEIRDTIMWLYGSGFPKSMSISKGIESKEQYGVAGTVYKKKIEMACEGDTFIVKQNNNGAMGEPKEFERKHYVPTSEVAKTWEGWGTCLKPAYEPIIVARKPCEGSCIDNVLTYGVGGINIDECRVPLESTYVYKEANRHSRSNNVFTDDTCGFNSETNHTASASPDGRFPSNVILTYDESDYDEVCGDMPYTESNGGASTMPDFQDAGRKNVANGGMNKIGYNAGDTAERKQSAYMAPVDSGSASRYFYCAKASNKDRDEGLDDFETKPTGELQGGRQEGSAGSIMANGDGTTRVNPYAGTGAPKKNTHPTVKPCELMQYLVRLVTPKGGTVLDPFNGSGSTGKAVIYESRENSKDYKYIGIEITEEYLPIANARIAFVENKPMQFKLF